MKKDDVISKLPTDDEGEFVNLGLFNCVIPVNDFVARFDGAEITYDALVSHRNSTESWESQFDEWKKNGIIS